MSQPVQENVSDENTADVIIIGAGLAGIAAARYFTKLAPSLKIIMLEAGDTCGGRLCSATVPCSGDSTNVGIVELGASYLHGIQNHPLMRVGQEIEQEEREEKQAALEAAEKLKLEQEAQQQQQLVDDQVQQEQQQQQPDMHMYGNQQDNDNPLKALQDLQKQHLQNNASSSSASSSSSSYEYTFPFKPLRAPPARGYYDASTGDEVSYYDEAPFHQLFSMIRKLMHHFSSRIYFNNNAKELDCSVQEFVSAILKLDFPAKSPTKEKQILAELEANYVQSIRTNYEKLVAKLGKEKSQRFILDNMLSLSGYYAMDINNCSIAGCMDPQEQHLAGGNHLMTEGHSHLVKKMVKILEKKQILKLKHKVTRIQWQKKQQVLVECETTQQDDDDDAKNNEASTTKQLLQYSARFVIVTVSVGVLKSQLIKFEPALPCQSAVDRFTMGVLNKVAIQFENVFWDNEDFFISFLPDDATHDRHFEFYMNLNYVYPNCKTVLGFVHGQYAKDLEVMSEQDVVKEFLKPFQPIIKKNNKEPQVVRVIKSTWHSNPYFCGSYSAVPIGEMSDLYDEMSNDCGGNDTLFMAGEATYREFPGTTTGAFLSGELAAKRILLQKSAVKSARRQSF